MESVWRHRAMCRSYPMAFARLVALVMLCGAAGVLARSQRAAASVLDPRVYLGPPDVDQTWVINENVVNFWRPGNVTERGGTVPGGLLLPQRALLVNNTLPGPPLNVVQGQLVRITIINYLLQEVVTIHWHGISQRGTPWNDGTEMVTQCAVEPGGKYTYMFKVDHAGTYFWHAHTGMEQEEGVVGQLVVRASPTSPDPQAALYDDDTQPAIIVHDWWRNPVGMLKAPGYLNYQNLEATLVNGFFAPVTEATAAKLPTPPGPPRKQGGPAAPPPAPPIAPENGTWAPTSTLLPPLASDLTVWNAGADGKGNWTTYTLNLAAGKCYRLRFINANGDFAGWQVAVVGHNLTLIAKDAEDLKPQVVRSFVFYGGNRVDAVLCTNNPAGGSFPLVFSSVSQISPVCPWFPNKCQWRVQALVTYPPITSTPAANRTTIKTGDATADAVDGQYDRQAWKPLTARKCVPNPTRSLRMSVGFSAPPGGPAGTKSWLWTEKVPFQMPMGPSLLNGLGCTALNNTHVEQVDSESEVLELVIDNLTDMPHPIHMHGGTFSVIDTNFYVEAAWEADIANATCPTGDVPAHSDPGWLTIANNTAAYQRFWGCTFGNTTAQRATWAARPGCSDKPNTQASLYETDTIPLPPRSWIVLRLYKWNPGHWLFHCHTNHHMLRGMSFLLNVLPSKVPPVPDWLLPATVTNATARAAWEAKGFATAGQCGPPCFGKRGTADGGPLSYSQYLKKHKPKP